MRLSASLLARNLANPCLGRKAKAKVETCMILFHILVFFSFCVYVYLFHCNKSLFILWSCIFYVFIFVFFVSCFGFRFKSILSSSISVVFVPMTPNMG